MKYTFIFGLFLIVSLSAKRSFAELFNCGDLFSAHFMVEEIVMDNEGSFRGIRETTDLETAIFSRTTQEKAPSDSDILWTRTHDFRYEAEMNQSHLVITATSNHKQYKPEFIIDDYRGSFIAGGNFWIMDKNADFIYVWNFSLRADRVLKIARPKNSNFVSAEYKNGSNPNQIFDKYLEVTFRVNDPIDGSYSIIMNYNPHSHQLLGEPQIMRPNHRRSTEWGE